MKKFLLLTYCSLMSCQVVANSANCISAMNCQANEFCDQNTATCMPMNTPVQDLTITSVSPRSGSQTASTKITITGSGFSDPMTVQIGSQLATQVTVNSSTELTALTPVSPSQCGSADVSMTRGDKATATAAAAFRYVQTGTFSLLNVSLLHIQNGVTADVSQIIIDDIDGDNKQDILVKSPGKISLCFGSSTGPTPCEMSLNHTVLDPNFMRLIDLNHDKKQSILVVPYRNSDKTKGQTGALFSYSGKMPRVFTNNQPLLGYPEISDVIQVDRLVGTSLMTKLWFTTDNAIYELPFDVSATLGNPTPIAKPGLANLQLARSETATASPQIVGTVPPGTAMPIQTGVAVVERTSTDLMFTVKPFTTLPINKLRLADVNGDGRPDLIGSTSIGQPFYRLLGQADGTYANPASFTVSTSSNSFEVADLTCGGSPGLVVVNSGAFDYLVGLSEGSAPSKSPIFSSGTAGNAAIAVFAVKDVNGDGRPDIVYLTSSGDLKVAINSVP